MEKEIGTRLSLEDTPLDLIKKVAGGNPGAMTVCMELLQREAKIDPDAALAPIASLMCLDTYHIYAADIWMLYKDVCGEDLVKMVAMLRATQLGFISPSDLKHAIDNYGDGIDVGNLVRQVKDRLPRFGIEEKLEEKII